MIFLLLFLFGACFGSFGSVLIWRTKDGIDLKKLNGILFGRSNCTSCSHKLGILDLFPILSWSLLGGKCRYCKEKISWIYPLLELFSGLIFVLSVFFINYLLGFQLTVFNFDLLPLYLFFIFTNWLLYLLVLADLFFYELNESIWWILCLLILGFLYKLSWGIGDIFFMESFSFGLVFGIGFLFVFLFGKYYVRFRFGIKDGYGFGRGDVMLAFPLGCLIGFFRSNGLISLAMQIQLFIVYLTLCSFLGILFWVVRKFFFKNEGQSIPFLPAMIVGYWLFIVNFDFWINLLN